jgi:hypothetical protein
MLQTMNNTDSMNNTGDLFFEENNNKLIFDYE